MRGAAAQAYTTYKLGGLVSARVSLLGLCSQVYGTAAQAYTTYKLGGHLGGRVSLLGVCTLSVRRSRAGVRGSWAAR